MTLFELFIQFGDPAKTYSDELVANFYQHVDDGTMFGEALAEMPDHDRERIADLIFDKTSRSLSHQMVGKVVVDQLRDYPRAHLMKNFDSLEPEIAAYDRAAALTIKTDDPGDAQGSQP